MCITEGLINQVICVDSTCSKSLQTPLHPITKADHNLVQCILPPPISQTNFNSSHATTSSPPLHIDANLPHQPEARNPLHPPRKTEIVRANHHDNILSPRNLSNSHHP